MFEDRQGDVSMTVTVSGQKISSRNLLGKARLVTFTEAWKRIEPRLPGPRRSSAMITLLSYKEADKQFDFGSWDELIADLVEASSPRSGGSLARKNKFFEEGGENNNVATVIYKSDVPQSSNGWNNADFFEKLGHARNARVEDEGISSGMLQRAARASEREADLARQGLRRRAEQEYLMQNMAKGPMFEAAQIATRKGQGIAVRGTGLLAHMGIESGAPTKSQEFKNKTSKEIDLWLCDELNPKDLGAVVHFDPRVGWSSREASRQSRFCAHIRSKAKGSESDWRKKWEHIQQRRRQQLPATIKLPPEDAVKKAFFSRLNEYLEEDYEYRWGHYAPYTELVGPCIRLKLRPDENMYGDHDLFVFTKGDGYGHIIQDETQITSTQVALQEANAFQAQHGGIWYWEPGTDFNRNIRRVIMGAHSPPDGEPLVYIMPNDEVTAAFYIPGNDTADRLSSVWDCPDATKWLKSTHSGELLLSV
jgi:hypothetical protein